MLRNVMTGRKRTVTSVATETYWSRGAMRWGPDLAVRYLLRPAPDTAPAPPVPKGDPNYLSTEAGRRLAGGPVRFELCIQRYRDERSTPIEDTGVEWKESVSPPEPVAVLTLPQGDITTVDALAQARIIDATAFNPWNTTDEFRPLGNLNRARKAAYDASAAHRQGNRWESPVPLHNRVIGGGARRAFSVVNRYVEWHRLPVRLGLLNLDAFRHELRHQNLIDTELRDAPPSPRPGAAGRAGGGDPPVPDLRRQLQRPLRPGHGCCRCGLRAQHRHRSTARTCSTSRTRSWSAGSCSTGSTSSRRDR